jgi:SAM-dependent methyltransferase
MAVEGSPFSGSIPETYDRFMGPLVFRPYAEELASRLAGFDGRLLEVAAGTGIVTRALDEALPPAARIVATDLSRPMLDYASARLQSPRVAWQEADGQALPFEDAGFEAVVCQFGVMFFPDRGAGYAEARRVLRPGGRYIFSVWDSLASNDAARIANDTVAARFQADPPDFMARIPHGYHDKNCIRADLAPAGFADVLIETVTLRGRADSAEAAAIAICQGTPLRSEIEARDPSGVEAVTQAVARAMAIEFGAGPIDTRIQALVITAVA